MNDIVQDTWYYSKGGERLGPVSFVELQAQAKASALNPRHDMVWKHGMPDWQPAGDIPDLFERKVVVPPPSLAPPADPYSTPQQESVAAQMGQASDWPGARRRSYIFITIIFPILWWVVILAFAMPFLDKTFGEQIMKIGGPLLMVLPFLLMIYFFFRRLVNLGMSCWWFFGLIIPFLNIWLVYRLFACPGGYAYTKKLGPAGIFLALLYWGSLLFSIILGVALALISMGKIGSPELKKQVIESVSKYDSVLQEKLKQVPEMAPAAKP